MAQSISLPPPSTACSRDAPRGLVYFIPGNPGYIEYYRDFLVALRSVIDSSSTHYYDQRAPSLHIYGRDLAGFQDGDHAPFSSSNPPVDVEGQISTTRRILEKVCARGIDGEGPRGPRGFDFVVLMGHSLGTFIALSLMQSQHALSPGSRLPIRHAVLLFATISHLAMSPRGRIAEPLLNAIPPAFVARVARVVVWPWPRRVLRWFLGRALGMEARAARVTERFLRSRDGVWQALSMAKDEMRVIAEERWVEGFWSRVDDSDDETARRGSRGGSQGSRSEKGAGRRARSSKNGTRRKDKAPRFFVFFGGRDGWVDNKIRNEFITRTKALGSVRAVVDRHGLPHDFCTSEFQSVLVAALIKDWIRDIQDALVKPEKGPGDRACQDQRQGQGKPGAWGSKEAGG